MVDDSPSRRLSMLRSESAASLRSFLRRRTGAGYTAAAADRTDAHSGAPLVRVNLMGQTIFLDDERRLRALAKEIKALITEDKRRGLGL